MHTLVHVKNAYTVMTICLIALGAALLFMPQLGLKTMCMLYGVFLIIYGVTKLSGYFAKDLFQLAFQFDLALGIVSIVLGSYWTNSAGNRNKPDTDKTKYTGRYVKTPY